LSNYDSDQRYPFYGFGGCPIGHHQVVDCFPLNKGGEEIKGIKNVLQAYRDAVNEIQFLGPTNFAPIIKKAREHAESCRSNKMYFVLLILTDGEINDMHEAITEIAYISDMNLPISIIIIGVGDEDFANMVRLDGDDVAIKSGCRDVVQFVKFKEVLKRSEPN